MKRTLLIGAIAIIATSAHAQNRNAFKQMDAIIGVTITQSTTQQGTAYTVTVGQNATVVREGKSHKLEAVEGLWLLSDRGDLGAVQTAVQNYDAHSNNSGGTSAYGWQTQLKNGLGAGESATFTFSNITNAGVLDHFGFKVKASGVPAHIYQDDAAACVPEPATMAVMGLGVAALRRKRKASK